MQLAWLPNSQNGLNGWRLIATVFNNACRMEYSRGCSKSGTNFNEAMFTRRINVAEAGAGSTAVIAGDQPLHRLSDVNEEGASGEGHRAAFQRAAGEVRSRNLRFVILGRRFGMRWGRLSPLMPDKLSACRADSSRMHPPAASTLPPIVRKPFARKMAVSLRRLRSRAHQRVSRRHRVLPLAPTMWRYDAVLPKPRRYRSEGVHANAAQPEYPNVSSRRRPESYGSFKARGLSAAVTMARHFG